MTSEQVSFNKAMNSVHQAVEWGFGKVILEFAFLDFKKKYQKTFLQNVRKMYKISIIITNCHTCLYGNWTGTYFITTPPTLEEYLMRGVIKSKNYLVYIMYNYY